MKSLCLVTEYYPSGQHPTITGGVENRAYNISQGLALRGWNVTVICSRQPSQPRVEKWHNLTVRRIGLTHRYSFTNDVFVTRSIFMLTAFLTTLFTQADIYEAENFSTYLPTGIAAMIRRKPRIIIYHEVWIGQWQKIKGKVTGFLGTLIETLAIHIPWTYIITVSSSTKKDLLNHASKTDRIVVIPNGIHNKEFLFSQDKKKNPTLCSIGRLTKDKRFADVLAVLPDLLKKFPNIHYHIIGDGPVRSQLQTMINKKGLQKNVTLHGRLKNTQTVREILKASHIFCLPSVVEGFGIVLLEAMASGTPYIAADIPAIREVTQNGTGGILIKPKDRQALRESITRLLANTDMYHKSQHAGKIHAQKYDWATIISQMDALLHSILKI